MKNAYLIHIESGYKENHHFGIYKLRELEYYHHSQD